MRLQKFLQRFFPPKKIGTCGRCYDEDVVIIPAPCDEKPEKLAGQPIGQYHCPDCGAMVIGGLPHPDLCVPCSKHEHPWLDEHP